MMGFSDFPRYATPGVATRDDRRGDGRAATFHPFALSRKREALPYRRATRDKREVEVARPFFTYILRCSDRSYYVGHTDEIERRLTEHETGATRGYTATRRPVQLVWFQEFPTREEAKAAEAQIKRWSRRKKEALIGGRMEELRAAARKDWVSYRQRRALR